MSKTRGYFDSEYVNYNIEVHPFPPFIPPNIKYLFIGTFPIHESKRQFDFYYSGIKNNFWKIMKRIYKPTFQFHTNPHAPEERRIFLAPKLIGITDMHLKCYRKNVSSSDDDLYPILLNDIFKILKVYSTIETLIFTSRTDAVGALGLLESYLIQNNVVIPEFFIGKDKIIRSELNFNNKKYKILVPYSPSNYLIEKGITDLNELTEMYKFCLSVV